MKQVPAQTAYQATEPEPIPSTTRADFPMNHSKNSTAMQAFAFDSHAVRVVDIDGQPWFVAKDVCACLEIDNHRNVVARLDEDEKGVQSLDTLGGPQEMAVINESGLYATILRSQGAMTPGTPAHAFRKWVTAEVLPAIRRTGGYSAPGLGQSMDAKLDRMLDGLGQVMAVLPRVLDVMEQMLHAMPKMLEATRPAQRQPGRKKMFAEDAARIQALSAKGYLLDDLVAETGFSQSQCWGVVSGRYKVLESGRVSIDLRTDLARAAETAARAQREGQTSLEGV